MGKYASKETSPGVMLWPGSSGIVTYAGGATWGASITDNSANWNTAYTDRLKWDGGSTGLVAATGRTSLGGTTVGSNLFTLTNPSAITFLRLNADNSVSALSVTDFKTALSLQNVTNESKATMFSSPTFTGVTYVNYLAFINKIYGNEDASNYYIGHYPVTGSDGLQIQWYGGIRLGVRTGNAIQILDDGTVIVGGITGSQKLTVHGEIGIRAGNSIVHYDSTEAHYWQQVPNGTTEYYWSYDGTWKMKLASDGTLTCKGNVIAYFT